MKYALAFALAFALSFPCAATAITIDTVLVGNPGNAPRVETGTTGGVFGGVAASYRIATTEVTNAQYVTFLNAVAASDPNGLYNTNMGFASRGGIVRTGAFGSFSYSVKPDVPDGGPDETNYTYGDKPVVYVSWYDAARFANWVNNGATAGASTETGAYTMANGPSVSRNTGSSWFLPTEDQWYKAAYYKGATNVYYNYPTGSNTAPDNVLPADDSGNSANYYVSDFTQNPSYPFTTVGAYAQSKSPYGTADQGGNVWEWTDMYGTNPNGTTNTSMRIRRGGSADTEATMIKSAYRESKLGTTELDNMGFRLATIAGGVTGDYNGNNIVDAADYVLWRKYLNQSVTLPNDSTPGMVTSADYTVWRSNFGQTPSGSGSGSLLSNAVPEPLGSLLGLFGLISLICFNSRRIFATSQRSRLY